MKFFIKLKIKEKILIKTLLIKTLAILILVVCFAFSFISNTLAARDFKVQSVAGIPFFFIEGDNGNVGIGSTSPATKLDVNGNIQAAYYYDRDNSDYYLNPAAGGTGYSLYSSGSIYASGVDDNYFAGDVGIGTTAPSHKLTVWSTNSSGEGSAFNVVRAFNSVGWGTGLNISLLNSNNSPIVYGSIGASITTNTAGSEDGYLTLSTRKVGTLTEQVRIDTNGNVGIGTTEPTTKLDVYGTQLTDKITSWIGIDLKQVGAPTTAITGTLQAGNELEIGGYYYRVSYITAIGESTPRLSSLVTTTSGNQRISINLQVSTDPRVTGRKIYRTRVDGYSFLMALVTTINNNTDTSYLDTTPDASLPASSQEAYFKVNTTNKFITISDTAAMTLDVQLTAFGFGAAENQGIGGENTKIGYNAGRNSASGSRQTIIGSGAGVNATGGNVVMIGSTVGSSSTGDANVLIGDYAGYKTSSSENVIIGTHAGYTASGSITGGRNTIIGRAALANYDVDFTGANNIFLGYVSGKSASQLLSASNSIAIGSGTFTTKSNQVILGNDAITETLLRGNVGIGTTVPQYKLDVRGAVAVGTAGATNQIHYVATPTTTTDAATKGYVDDASVDHAATADYATSAGSADHATYANSALRALYLGDSFDVTADSQGNLQVNGTGNSYLMGNVAIGTTSPDYQLTVTEDFGFDDASMYIEDVSGATTVYSNNFYALNGSNYLKPAETGTALNVAGVIQVNGSGNNYFAGNVGIGTTSPAAKLQVKGVARFTRSTNDNHYLEIGAEGGLGQINSVGNIALSIAKGGTEIARFGATTGGLSIGTTYSATDPGMGNMIIQGNVGIGTTVPNRALHVVDAISSVIRLEHTGSTTYTELAHTGTEGSLITYSSARSLVLGTNSQEYMRIATDGKVGIGTTGPNEKLHVSGDLIVAGGDIYITHDGATNSNNEYIKYDDGSQLGSGGTFHLHADSARGVAWSSPTAAISAKGGYFAGKVGIGTDDPQYSLDIRDPSAGEIYLPDSLWATGTDDFAATVGYVDYTAGGGVPAGTEGQTLRNGAGSWVTADNLYNNGTNVGIGDTSLTYKLEVNGEAQFDGALRARDATGIGFRDDAGNLGLWVEDGGNVGIGTTNPGGKLHVYGGSYFSTSHSAYYGDSSYPISIYNGGASTTEEGIFMRNAGGSVNTGIKITQRVGSSIDTELITKLASDLNSSIFTISTTSGGILGEKIRIDNTGNVAIGTTSAGYRLDVLSPDAIDSYMRVQRYDGDVASGIMLSTGASTPLWTMYVDGGSSDLLLEQNGIVASIITTDGYFGIGPDYLTPQGLLDVNNKFIVTDTQVTMNVPLNLAAAGDISIASDLQFTSPTASYIKSYAPLYIEAGDPSQNVDLTLRGSNSGEVIVDDILRVTDNAYLSGITMSGNIDLQDIYNLTGVNKLTVNTIDPIHEINGKEYATFVSFYAGGQKMETSGVIQLVNQVPRYSGNQEKEDKNTQSLSTQAPNPQFFHVIDFEKLEEGSDLWLFWETIHQDLDKLTVILTPGFDGRVWYEKISMPNPQAPEHPINQLVIYSDQPGEVSYTLVAPRYDYKKWPNLISKDRNRS